MLFDESKYDYYMDPDGEILRVPHKAIIGEVPTFAPDNYEPPEVYDVDSWDKDAREWSGYGDYTVDFMDTIIDAWEWEPMTEEDFFLEIL